MTPGRGESNGDPVAGRKVIAAAGTPEPLLSGPNAWYTDIWISALPTNTKPVYIGDAANVNAGAGTEAGAIAPDAGMTPLHFSGAETIRQLYADAEVNGEGVTFTLQEP